MYGLGGGNVVGAAGVGAVAATTTAASIVLPNTGSHALMSVAAIVSLLVGVGVVASTLARVAAKRLVKA